MTLDEIRTGIRTLPAFDPSDSVDVLASMVAHMPAKSRYSNALLDCIQEIESYMADDAQDTRPADESWKARQDAPLFRTFAESFDALDKLSVQP